MKIIKRFAVAFAAALALVAMTAGPSFAASDHGIRIAAAAAVLTFSLPPALVVGIVASVILPAFVGFVTNSNWSPAAKGILLAICSAVTGFATELGDALSTGTSYDVGIGLVTTVGVAIGGVAVYFGFLSRPTKSGTSLADRLAAIGNKAPSGS